MKMESNLLHFGSFINVTKIVSQRAERAGPFYSTGRAGPGRKNRSRAHLYSGLDPPNFLNYKNSPKVPIENLNIDKIFSCSGQNTYNKIVIKLKVASNFLQTTSFFKTIDLMKR